jgi:hypothetical protein
VYAAVLNSVAPGGTLVVVDSTRKWEPWWPDSITDGGLRDLEVMSGVSRDLAEDFIAANRSSHRIPAAIPAKRPLTPVRRASLPFFRTTKPDFSEEAWTAFYRKHPGSGGFQSLSAVGYDRAGNTALVSYDLVCGDLCGHGLLVVLERRNGGWEIVHIEDTWVS